MNLQHQIIQSLPWHARRALERLGLVGVAGLGLLAFCAMYYFSAYVPARHEVRLLQRDLEVERSASLAVKEVPSPAKQLQQFYESFPNEDTAPDAIARLNEVALANGVALEQGEYNLVRKEGEKLAQYGVVLPVKGDYIHLRKFIFQSLAAMPNLALNGVEFQRQKISETTLEARVKMTVFLVSP